MVTGRLRWLDAIEALLCPDGENHPVLEQLYTDMQCRLEQMDRKLDFLRLAKMNGARKVKENVSPSSVSPSMWNPTLAMAPLISNVKGRSSLQLKFC
jgi:hypothetical protein